MANEGRQPAHTVLIALLQAYTKSLSIATPAPTSARQEPTSSPVVSCDGSLRRIGPRTDNPDHGEDGLLLLHFLPPAMPNRKTTGIAIRWVIHQPQLRN